MPDDPNTDTSNDDKDGTSALSDDAVKWKALSRKNENDKKAAIAELNTLREQLTSQTSRADALAAANEAAVAKAKTDATADARKDLVKVHAEFAAKAHGVDPAALLEGRDLSAFLGDDGSVKADDIEAWISKIAPAGAPKPVNFGGGSRGDGTKAAPHSDDPLFQALSNLTSE
jgi:hypothetical protein